MKERFLAEANAEYSDAAAYYESREAGLGDRFLEEVDEFLAIAHEFPKSGLSIVICGKQTTARALLRRTLSMFEGSRLGQGRAARASMGPPSHDKSSVKSEPVWCTVSPRQDA